MSEVASNNLESGRNFDAQQAAEEMANSEHAPRIDVAADYEASKQFSVSDVDRTGEGAEAAAKATAPGHAVSQAEEPQHPTQATGAPEDYREMAREINHGQQGHNVDDELVKKALEMEQGQTAQQ